MARITGEMSDESAAMLRKYLIDTEGTTRRMGQFLERLVLKELTEKGYMKGNANALPSA